ncbi:MAG: GspE/PulE family protein, partial [Planctomycetia bacterium]
SKPGQDKRIERAQESAYYQMALEVVYDAFLNRATDVHLEPGKEDMAVRFRVDGIMNQMESLDRHSGDAVINIIKVLADLDIAEKRKPQDGSFSAEVTPPSEDDDEESDKPKKKKKPIILDFRVATAGSVSGEKMVMRILDSSKSLASLKKLGMREKQRESIQGVVSQPHGMFIVCGPTGAGKSTTLYACLSEIDRFTKNVITLENPVEYQMDNVTQIEVNPKAGKTFASELRSILRQDPDVIYVGEIRDKETAEIACQAAQTGHMVFTTLHANDSVTAIGRLIDLGVAPFMVANAVSCILAQRLVRLLCPKCKVRYKPNPEILRKFNLSPDKHEYFYKAKGEDGKSNDEDLRCAHCGGTGYRGRTGVFEIFVLGESIKTLIQNNPSLNLIRQEAIKGGMKYLLEDGLRQVVAGNTSINEILRVCK